MVRQLNGWGRYAVFSICLAVASMAVEHAANAKFILWSDAGNGFETAFVFSNDGDLESEHYYDPDGIWIGTYFYSDGYLMVPWRDNPDGSPSGGVDEDSLDMLRFDLKNMGGTTRDQDPWRNLVGHVVLSDGKTGPNVIDPYDLGGGVLADSDYDGTSSGLGLDPTVPLGEQLPRGARQTDEDDDDDDDQQGAEIADPSSWGEYYGLDPSLVNPVPVQN